MAVIDDVAEWQDTIDELKVTDIIGGANDPQKKQVEILANRTLFIKTVMDIMNGLLNEIIVGTDDTVGGQQLDPTIDVLKNQSLHTKITHLAKIKEELKIHIIHAINAMREKEVIEVENVDTISFDALVDEISLYVLGQKQEVMVIQHDQYYYPEPVATGGIGGIRWIEPYLDEHDFTDVKITDEDDRNFTPVYVPRGKCFYFPKDDRANPPYHRFRLQLVKRVTVDGVPSDTWTSEGVTLPAQPYYTKYITSINEVYTSMTNVREVIMTFTNPVIVLNGDTTKINDNNKIYIDDGKYASINDYNHVDSIRQGDDPTTVIFTMKRPIEKVSSANTITKFVFADFGPNNNLNGFEHIIDYSAFEDTTNTTRRFIKKGTSVSMQNNSRYIPLKLIKTFYENNTITLFFNKDIGVITNNSSAVYLKRNDGTEDKVSIASISASNQESNVCIITLKNKINTSSNVYPQYVCITTNVILDAEDSIEGNLLYFTTDKYIIDGLFDSIEKCNIVFAQLLESYNGSSTFEIEFDKVLTHSDRQQDASNPLSCFSYTINNGASISVDATGINIASKPIYNDIIHTIVTITIGQEVTLSDNVSIKFAHNLDSDADVLDWVYTYRDSNNEEITVPLTMFEISSINNGGLFLFNAPLNIVGADKFVLGIMPSNITFETLHSILNVSRLPNVNELPFSLGNYFSHNSMDIYIVGINTYRNYNNFNHIIFQVILKNYDSIPKLNKASMNGFFDVPIDFKQQLQTVLSSIETLFPKCTIVPFIRPVSEFDVNSVDYKKRRLKLWIPSTYEILGSSSIVSEADHFKQLDAYKYIANSTVYIGTNTSIITQSMTSKGVMQHIINRAEEGIISTNTDNNVTSLFFAIGPASYAPVNLIDDFGI